MIDVRNLRFRYPASAFQLSVDALAVAAGERLAVVGPSGSGKTTLLNLLAGILTPDEGSIRVAGTNVSCLSGPARRDFRISEIGLVFQQFELIDYLTVADNIRLPFLINRSLSQTGQTGEAAEARPASTTSADLLVSVGLAGFEKRYPSELSRGEQQRVAICRAISTTPKIILADEPTGNLDPSNKTKILDLLFEQADARAQTLIVVTHDHSVLSKFDRVIDFETFLRVDPSASEANA